ncbi:MAG: winged helix-turn-helix domain-containing protein [Candidatus Peribacteria bacterium]|nr:winged helix-turn-helix domain-containing protein [Candidatus Peribacteria bacterium]
MKKVSETDSRQGEKTNIIHLTLKEFQILEFLIKNKGRALSRTDIITELWGDDAIWEADNKLDVYMSTLRRKLDKDIITTVKGFGYTIGGTDTE